MGATGSMDRAGLEEAEATLRAMLRQEPANAPAIHDLGVLAYRDGRTREALHLVKQALALEPKNVAMLKSYGQMLRETGDAAGAAEVFHRALEIEPRSAAVWNAAGVCLQESAQPAQAMEAYLRALALEPEFPEALNNVGIVLLHEKNVDAAVEYFEQALALRPEYADAHNNLGVALRERLEYDRATEHFQTATELKPESSEFAAGLGEVLSLVYRPGAEEVLRRAVALAPENAERHWNLGLELLKQGKLAEGFREYEWRWKRGGGHNPPRVMAQPYWLGVEEIRGRTLLIHAEQGIGDTVQMLRYVPMALERGARVVLEVQPELWRLVEMFAARFGGAVTVAAAGDALPSFDCHVATMSLPLAFGTTLATVPAPMRLTPSATKRRGDGLRVGVSWAGNVNHPRDRERTIPFERVRPLLAMDGVTWVSLQVGAAVRSLEGMAVEQPRLRDFADTAEVMDGLDVVVTVDSAVAHLAATQGVATWVMLPYVADWRWLAPPKELPSAERNAWYPAARMFRQTAFPEDADAAVRWGPVVEAVAAELQKLVSEGGFH